MGSERRASAEKRVFGRNARPKCQRWVRGRGGGNATLLPDLLPNKLDLATWLNYVRCHDDIGLGFDDADIRACGYDPCAHRRFLLDWFAGNLEGSPARGLPFGVNAKTGDARIAGALTSLVRLETALEQDDQEAIDHCVELILTLRGMIQSFGGIPLIWYGDEIGTHNDKSFLDDAHKAGDTRWIHRPQIDGSRAEERQNHSTVEQRIFTGLKRLIAARKTLVAFADFNNRERVDRGGQPTPLPLLRTHPSLQRGLRLGGGQF